MTPVKKDLPDDEGTNLPDAVLANDDRIPIDWNTDPLAVQRKIVDRIFKASTVDEVFEVYAGDSTAALRNKVFTVLEVSFAPYESERGVIPMAHVDGTLEGDGEITSWRTTSTSIVAMLAKLHALQAFPLKVRIVGNPTRGNFTAYHLEKA
jgi:hypothetical protein